MTNLNEMQPAELLEMLANATQTYYECSGHHKAHMNEMRIKEYKEALIAKGISIPTDKELLETGIFNGNGAY